MIRGEVLKKIKYIGFYNSLENANENRISVMSATNKMDYIISKFNQLDYEVDLISPSWTNNDRWYSKKIIELNNKTHLFLPPTIPWKKKMKLLSVLFSQLWLFFNLLFSTKKDETILVYHSLFLMYPLYFAKKIKRFTLLLEVEEVYQHARKTSLMSSKMEYMLFDIADKYIFSTEILNEKINHKNKPFTIIYGTYQVEEEQIEKKIDSQVHVVYAGTFDPRKGGGTIAVSTAPYLPENYHIHIIGFGSKEQEENIIKLISEYRESSKCEISYGGLLKGEEYIHFLKNCHIGLSTQSSDAEFNNTSFPSKVLSYMANGLNVVSVRIKPIELSKIGTEVYYYEEQTPESIAKAIKSINPNTPNNNREVIRKLDREFEEQLKELMEI